MKNAKAGFIAVAILIGALLAFAKFENGSIRGMVTPGDAASMVWAISAKDTFKNVINGSSFQITNVKAGTYKIIIEAKPPYHSAVREGVEVMNDGPTNVGEIRLEK